MFKLIIKHTALMLVATAILVAVPATASSRVANKADAAKDLTTQELYRIYKGRSWMWSDGGAYFRISRREFTAWVGHGRKSSIAKGIWYLPGRGKTCFRATWTAVKWKVGKRTCFAHRTDGKNIYQRKLPDGKWYVFKHTPVRRYDEFRKLKQGNRIGRNYVRNSRYINARRTNKSCRTKRSFSEFLTCIFKK